MLTHTKFQRQQQKKVYYFPFLINEECSGQATADYKLTAHFAKKLSCKGNGENGRCEMNYYENDVRMTPYIEEKSGAFHLWFDCNVAFSTIGKNECLKQREYMGQQLN